MQEKDGSMTMLNDFGTEDFIKPDNFNINAVIRVGKYFKIKQTYFKIDSITTDGIIAKGVSRKEYFKNR